MSIEPTLVVLGSSVASPRAGVTRQLLAVGRKNPVQASVLDLNVAVGALGGMLRRLIGNDIAAEHLAYLRAVLHHEGSR